MEEVDKAIFESGLSSPSSIEAGIKSQHCLVDTGKGTCIDMDGNLFLCEHYINGDVFSTIYHPEVKDFSMFEKWREYTDNHSEQCLACPLRATCLKMKRCTDQYECVGYEQQYHINQVKRHMILCQK
jgi:radical SAM protein with 4Fe4S-binding SPASM domain